MMNITNNQMPLNFMEKLIEIIKIVFPFADFRFEYNDGSRMDLDGPYLVLYNEKFKENLTLSLEFDCHPEYTFYRNKEEIEKFIKLIEDRKRSEAVGLQKSRTVETLIRNEYEVRPKKRAYRPSKCGKILTPDRRKYA